MYVRALRQQMVSRMCEHQRTQTVSEMIICVIQKQSHHSCTHLNIWKNQFGCKVAGQRDLEADCLC